jgi:hypothetical protein
LVFKPEPDDLSVWETVGVRQKMEGCKRRGAAVVVVLRELRRLQTCLRSEIFELLPCRLSGVPKCFSQVASHAISNLALRRTSQLSKFEAVAYPITEYRFPADVVVGKPVDRWGKDPR